MDYPENLILEDVRCFQGKQHGRLRPVTLLVGENNTGKTSFLGCHRVIYQVLSGRLEGQNPDFNLEPFLMGSFRDIVRHRMGSQGRINEFKIGIYVRNPRHGTPPYELLATFHEEGSQPVVSSFEFRFDESNFLRLESVADGVVLQIPKHNIKIEAYSLDFLVHVLTVRGVGMSDNLFEEMEWFQKMRPIIRYMDDLCSRSSKSSSGRMRKNNRRNSSFEFPRLSRLIPIAPIRSKPKRTYDPVREVSSPEGEHVPMLMMRLFRTKEPHWKSLHDKLVAFGDDSGLFSDIKVKSHGKQIRDPFQIQVKTLSGLYANLMDVGYGISQSLPILIDVLEASERTQGRESGITFLLQQPEVHLHPRGQAQLANFFAKTYNESKIRFLIETHSDYIVDRTRYLVRKKVLKREDVSIIFFEPKRNSVNMHNISLDDQGNIVDPPTGYRDFFSKEIDRTLGFSD